MKIGKSFFTAAAALLMAATLGLAACGGGGNNGHTHVDRNADGRCDECGDIIEGEYTSPEWEWKYEGDYHWQVNKTDGSEKTGSRGLHWDEEGDGKCDVCGAPVAVAGDDGGEHTSHSFVWMRDGKQHWKECSCGEKTEKASHVQNANYRCECGYAYDAPAEGGLSSTNYWIVGTFTDGNGWGETHSDTWKFHRTLEKDADGRTQYIFEIAFKGGEEFKIVKDGGGYWDGEINAGHLSDSARKLFDGNGGGNIRVIGGEGYYVITLHAGSGNPSVEAEMLYGEGSKPKPHEHSYSTAWETDANNHWHPSTCEHTGLKKDNAAHSFENGSYVCSVCGYEKPHDHIESKEWVMNGTFHWKICTLCGRKIASTEEEHSGEPCKVCGYDVAVSGAIKLEYDKASDSYFVTGYDNDKIEAEVRIPATYKNKQITKITNKAFMGCEKIKKIVLPDSITCVDIYSFCNCAFLESVTLGNGVKEIGMAAFENCSALKDIKFPESLTKLGMSAFENTSITEFTVGKNLVEIGAFAFRTKQLDKVTFEVTAGWKVYPLLSNEGTAIDVSNPAENATKFSIAPFQDPEGRANYDWKRG